MVVAAPATIWTRCGGFKHDGGEKEIMMIHGGLGSRGKGNVVLANKHCSVFVVDYGWMSSRTFLEDYRHRA